MLLEQAGDRLCLSEDDHGVPLGAGRGEGTSLGLDLVRALAQQLGGRLEVEPVRGRGKFCVEFPVPKACPPQAAAAMMH